MTAGLVQFHIAIVTGELAEATQRYGRVLGVDRWHYWDRMPPGSPARVAYGRGSGTTWELIGIEGDAETQFHDFYRRHGEGVQHIGFWCPDLRARVKEALEAGGEILTTIVDAQGNAVVHVRPGDLDVVPLPNNLFVAEGIGFTMEYFGPGGEQMYRDWFGEDYERMLRPPPWG